MALEDSSHGWLGVLAKRGMNFLLRYHTHYQGEINLKFAAFMRELQVEQDSHATQLAAARQHTAALDAGLAALTTVCRDLARLDGYFSARPYMARDAYATAGDLHTPMGYADPKRDALADGAAPDFADLFRGSEEFIRDRQRVYLQFCKAASKIVDLGSGRGEFLDLLREQGVDAVGVELDASMVERCRGRGLCVEHADAFEYLERLPRESVDVIFSAQFVEHVESSRLAELLELARGRLRPRGLFIAETVNPESYLAQKTFFVDLSHQRPIFPQVLLHMCQTSGYASARIFYPGAGGFTQLGYREAGEYAIVAMK